MTKPTEIGETAGASGAEVSRPADPDRRSTSRRSGMGDAAKVWAPCLILALVGLGVASSLIQPGPPRSVTLLAGPRGGAYWAYAQQYKPWFDAKGITLNILETKGSRDNIQQMLSPEPGVHLAMVQGGTVLPEEQATLRSIVRVGYEPLWMFTRRGQGLAQLRDLVGQRIAMGEPGSGTLAMAQDLLKRNGLDGETGGSPSIEAVELGGDRALAALRAGQVDAMLMVMAPDGPKLATWLADPELLAIPFERAPAYAGRVPYLAAVTVHEGVVDLERNLPDRDLALIAPSVVIAAHQDTHPAIAQLMTYAAVSVHRDHALLNEPGFFPNTHRTGLEVYPDVEYFLANGPSYLQRHLPFWMASLVERTIILVIPLLALLIPLFRAAPPLYRWRIRSRIYRWYKQVRLIDEALAHQPDRASLQREDGRLETIERELLEVNVPLSYMDDFYNLRLHVAFVHDRVRRALHSAEG